MTDIKYATNDLPAVPRARVYAVLGGLAASALTLAPTGYYAFVKPQPKDLFSAPWVVTFWAVALAAAVLALVTRKDVLATAIGFGIWGFALLNAFGWVLMLDKVH
jgi:hypothetical protein